MIFSVSGLEDALCAVRLTDESSIDGNIFGYSPMMPKNVQATIVSADESHAEKYARFLRKNFVPTRATTATKITMNK